MLGIGLALGVGLPGFASGQEGAFVRTTVDPSGPITVGQPVTIRLEVFVPTFFTGAPAFPNIDVDNAIATPPGRSQNLTERIGGATWAGQRREYTIYPQVAGRYDVSPIVVTVGYRGVDEPVEVASDAVNFDARIPDEARGLDYFIGTARFTLSQTANPGLDTIRVGESITRTLSMSVVDALSLVIPPITFDSIPGLSVYPDPAVVEDEEPERGGARLGSRTESVTYVAVEPGDYVLPGVEVAWWDLAARRMRTSAAPAIDFTVVENPDYVAAIPMPVVPDSVMATPAPSGGVSRRTIGFIVGGLLAMVALGFAIRRYAPAVLRALRDRRQRRRESEAWAFREFARACRAREAGRVMESLRVWLLRTDDPDSEVIADSRLVRENPAFAAQIERLAGGLYSNQPTDAVWDPAALLGAARAARGSFTGRVPDARAETLVALNPRGG